VLIKLNLLKNKQTKKRKKLLKIKIQLIVTYLKVIGVSGKEAEK